MLIQFAIAIRVGVFAGIAIGSKEALKLSGLIFMLLAYAKNKQENLPGRIRMMQYWTDYLDGLRQGADIVPLHNHRQA